MAGFFLADAGYAGVSNDDKGKEDLKNWTDNYSFVETGLVVST